MKASFESPYGTISSDWSVVSRKLYWKIEIPVGTTATVVVPTRVHVDPGKLPSYTEGGNTKIFLPSGKYVLQSK